MLRWQRDSRAHISQENVLASKTNGKEGHKFDSRKGKKEGGGREGRKDGRKRETKA
jgi:hypothetical protein